MKKAILIFTIFISLFFTSNLVVAGVPSGGQNVDLFSNFTVNGETGDCGGYELWLFRIDDALYGQFAVYEGNCTAEKKNIEDIKYNPKTGALSFKVPYYSEDSMWIFSGRLKNNSLSGTFSVVTKARNESTFNDEVVLLKIPN